MSEINIKTNETMEVQAKLMATRAAWSIVKTVPVGAISKSKGNTAKAVQYCGDATIGISIAMKDLLMFSFSKIKQTTDKFVEVDVSEANKISG